MSIKPSKDPLSEHANYCANTHLSLPRCQLDQLEPEMLTSIAIKLFLESDDEFNDSANFAYVKGYN